MGGLISEMILERKRDLTGTEEKEKGGKNVMCVESSFWYESADRSDKAVVTEDCF